MKSSDKSAENNTEMLPQNTKLQETNTSKIKNVIKTNFPKRFIQF